MRIKNAIFRNPMAKPGLRTLPELLTPRVKFLCLRLKALTKLNPSFRTQVPPLGRCDGGDHKLPKTDHTAPEWQAAMSAL